MNQNLSTAQDSGSQLPAALLEGVRDAARDFWNLCKGGRSSSCFSSALSLLRSDPRITAALHFLEGNKALRNPVVEAFRDGMPEFYRHARALLHGLEKPFGYPGDFSVLEFVYDQAPHPDSPSTLGRSLDRWAENLTLPRAVRERKNFLRFWLERYAATFDDASTTKPHVLSIAAGAAREIRDMQSSLRDNLSITLLDADDRGMSFALAMLKRDPRWKLPTKIVADAVMKDFRKALPRGQEWSVIYSFGLVDYLPDSLTVRLLKRCASILAPDGRLLFCIKDARYYDPWVYDWLFDWRFVPRTREDGHALAQKAGLQVLREYMIEDGVITIYECSAEFHHTGLQSGFVQA